MTKEQQVMATNNSKQFAQNQLARFDPNFMQLGIVMDNRDPTHSGKLKVWIEGSQSDRDSKDGWIEVKYLAPFAGRTPGVPGANSYNQYPKGYGFWAVPPDVGCTVAVMFKQGRIFDGYWFACLYDDRMNTMVPGMATQVLPNSGYDMPVPVTDYDRNTIQTTLEEKYPNVPMIEGLKKQNLLYDEEKGCANRSSTRQTTSTVYGMSSPRGNSFILDDGYTEAEMNAPTWDQDPDGYQDTQFNNPVNDTVVGGRKNEGIVLRTRSGAQILLSEATGDVLIINRDGTARIEFSGDGDINMHCDKNINIRSGQDINFNAGGSVNYDVGKDMNWRVNGNTKLDLIGSLDSKIGSQVVINAGADLRLVTGASLRIQSGSSTNITAGTDVSIKGTTANIIGDSVVNISGGGQTLTVDASGNTGSAAFMAPDFKSPNVGLNDHIHYHQQFTNAENHSDAMAPPVQGGGSSNTSEAIAPEPANDVEVQTVQVQETEAVQFINSTTEVGEVLTQDLTQDPAEMTYPQTFEGLQMLMPVNGIIREYGYWGKNVPTEKGTTANRNGWIIQAKGDVIAPDEGMITLVGKDGVVITHRSGYKSVFYGLTVGSIYDKDVVDKGSKIGIANGNLVMEVRTKTANLFGFSGTVDPGLFYTTVTGQGADAAGKTLILGEVSNKNAPPISQSSSSIDSDELVVIKKVRGIGTGYSQRGSKRIPRRTTARSRATSNYQDSAPRVDLSKIDKTLIGWKVQASDKQLVDDCKEFEGSIAYQTRVGTFRNGKFWMYPDPTPGVGNDIGYGHLITRQEQMSGKYANGLTPDEADQVLIKDLQAAVDGAYRIYAQYGLHTPYMAQVVLVEMCFQMGAGAVRKFTGMLKALKAGNYKLAAHEMRDSTWYKQTRRRTEELARRIEACA